MAFIKFEYCHYCEEENELHDEDVQRRNGNIMWKCCKCGMYNEEEE